MKPFDFEGALPASKSLFNRWAVVGSFEAKLKLLGDSNCHDVVRMKSALTALAKGEAMDCGEAGTVLRFLAFRAARVPGRHRLIGHPRLFARPQAELVELLGAVGVKATLSENELMIEGSGWQKPAGPIKVRRERSSQFLSGFVLSAWDLPFALPLELEGEAVSESYWKMTRAVVLRAGMKLSGGRPGSFEVLPRQRVRYETIDVEPDLSSAFAVAALAARGGRAWIKNFPETSLQPDRVFPDLLKSMGFRVDRKREGGLEFRGPEAGLRAIEADLRETPDLFPVLAVLGALAEGRTRLFGAPHLRHKESDRVAATASLLADLGIESQARDDGLELTGPVAPSSATEVEVDAHGDHRIVMAAWVLKRAGFALRVRGEGAVAKSFPEFTGIART